MAQKKAQKNLRSQSGAERSRNSSFLLPLFAVLILTVLIYFLRGIGVLSFLPGGVLLLLIGLSLILGISYSIDKTRRF
jgi:Na+/H+ antiporter NhaC